ncbi:endolytic transglycosylase MltG [Clostridium malenominatum]|uniref:Endolytic murein transglycosylase n=1 Tax=Clostridium malenominatum TaxID=1539 RepID=A0ABN1J6C5_9CLOT
MESLAKQLEDKSIIKSKDIFLMYTKLNKFNSNIKSSKLIIKQGTSYKELISKLKTGKSDFSIVTIPEGFTLYQIGERLEKDTTINKESLLKINISDLTSNNIVAKKPNTYYDLEGFLYPDTYYIPVDATEKDIAKLMFSRFKSIMSDEYINRAKELDLDINEVITIASLIEKEAANDSERSKIAGVIYNRIKKGMPLQVDASVIYANTKGKKIMQKVTYNDLKIQDLYNTYVYKELPPGPIASPGKASIEAALYPENHDYLYYVANGKGHVFSKTYSEHLNNVKKYIK